MLRLVVLRILESYFRHRWLYLMPIVLMGAMSVVYVLNLKPVYQAGGVIYVQNESLISSLNAIEYSDFGWVTPAELYSQELLDLLQTDSFVRALIQQTDLEQELTRSDVDVEELIKETRKSVWPQPIGNNQMLVVAIHEDAKIAYQLVNAAIEGHIQWQINASRNESAAAQDFFATMIVTYKADVDTARAELERYLLAHPLPVRGERTEVEALEIDQLQGSLALAENRYASALDKEESARLLLTEVESDVRQTYVLLDAPQLPDRPESSTKDMLVIVVIFLAAGVLMVGAGIVGGALLDNTFRYPIDVENLVGLPVLTTVSAPPKVKKRKQKKQKPAENEDSRVIQGQVELKDQVAA